MSQSTRKPEYSALPWPVPAEWSKGPGRSMGESKTVALKAVALKTVTVKTVKTVKTVALKTVTLEAVTLER